MVRPKGGWCFYTTLFLCRDLPKTKKNPETGSLFIIFKGILSNGLTGILFEDHGLGEESPVSPLTPGRSVYVTLIFSEPVFFEFAMW